MLADYNRNPYNTKAAKMTFDEVYEEWSKKKFPTVSESKYRNYYNSYWTPLVEQIGINRTLHCTRHTCIFFPPRVTTRRSGRLEEKSQLPATFITFGRL